MRLRPSELHSAALSRGVKERSKEKWVTSFSLLIADRNIVLKEREGEKMREGERHRDK